MSYIPLNNELVKKCMTCCWNLNLQTQTLPLNYLVKHALADTDQMLDCKRKIRLENFHQLSGNLDIFIYLCKLNNRSVISTTKDQFHQGRANFQISASWILILAFTSTILLPSSKTIYPSSELTAYLSLQRCLPSKVVFWVKSEFGA